MTMVGKNQVHVVSIGKNGRTAEVVYKGRTYHCRRQPKASAFIGGRMIDGEFAAEISVQL